MFVLRNSIAIIYANKASFIFTIHILPYFIVFMYAYLIEVTGAYIPEEGEFNQ